MADIIEYQGIHTLRCKCPVNPNIITGANSKREVKKSPYGDCIVCGDTLKIKSIVEIKIKNGKEESRSTENFE